MPRPHPIKLLAHDECLSESTVLYKCHFSHCRRSPATTQLIDIVTDPPRGERRGISPQKRRGIGRHSSSCCINAAERDLPSRPGWKLVFRLLVSVYSTVFVKSLLRRTVQRRIPPSLSSPPFAPRLLMTTAVCTCVVLVVLFTYRSFFPCRYDTGGAHSQRLLLFRGVTIPGSTNAFPYIPLHSEQTLRFKTRRRSLLFPPLPFGSNVAKACLFASLFFLPLLM